MTCLNDGSAFLFSQNVGGATNLECQQKSLMPTISERYFVVDFHKFLSVNENVD